MTNTDNQSELELIQNTSQIHSDQSPPTLTEQIRTLTEQFRTLTEELKTSEDTNYTLEESIDIYSKTINKLRFEAAHSKKIISLLRSKLKRTTQSLKNQISGTINSNSIHTLTSQLNVALSTEVIRLREKINTSDNANSETEAI